MRTTHALPREYIELQLRFASWLAHGDASSVPGAVLQGTNLFRRFQLGDPSEAAGNAEWDRFVLGLRQRSEMADRLDWAESFRDDQLRNPERVGERMTQAPLRAGAFSAEVRGDVLRFHFEPELGGMRSPLHPVELAVRRGELADLVRRALTSETGIRTVAGGSWLYGTAGYRSLFPPAHVATAQIRTGLTRFQGSSSWGQFLDHRGAVKRSLGAAFVDALARSDPSAPWRIFPMPARWVESPVSVFADHFGC